MVAQAHLYDAAGDRAARLRWAGLSLEANRRLHDGSPWQQSRILSQEFALRMWVIAHLGGADCERAWDPQHLAADTLAVLPPDTAESQALATRWRELSAERIGELRRLKNLTAHVGRLLPELEPGPLGERLAAWAAVRERLP